MIVLQLLLYCLLFTAMVKIAVIGGAVNGLYFYPKEVQDRAIELGLIDRNTMNRKRKCFMIPFFIMMLAALVLIIGLWNEASSFGEAYWQALLFLEVMNIYDGVAIDKLWVGHSQFWVLPGLEDAPFVQTWRQVLKKRSILALIPEMSQGRHSNVGTVFFFCGRLQRDDGTGCGTGIAHG